MKHIKIYSLFLLVFVLAFLGSDCRKEDDNPNLQKIDTTKFNIIEKSEFTNIEKFLNGNGVKISEGKKFLSFPNKFAYVINTTSNAFTFEYYTSSGGPTPVTKTIPASGTNCLLTGTTYVEPNANKIIIKYGSDELCEITTSSNTIMVRKTGLPEIDVLVPRELCDPTGGRCVRPSQENLVGVIIMNK